MKKLVRTHFPFLLCLVVIAVFMTRNLWGTRAWIETHDGIYHLVRQEVFSDALKRGNFPVRWAGSLDNGFGLPLFNYIYPGPYYLGAPLSLLGFNSRWVIKFVEIILYFIGGLGMYFLFAKTHKLYATVTSILYLTTPYLLFDIFIRGALGEVMAISCIPWILIVLSDIKISRKLRWYHPLPYFLMFIAHNFLSLLFLPIYLIIITCKFRNTLGIILKSFLLSLGLAAFFFLPMLAEQKYLYSLAISNFTYNYSDHFIYPIQLFFGKWGNGFSYPGINDGFSVALGFSSLVILGSGIVVGIRKKNQDLLLWLVLTGLIIFSLLPISAFFWRILTPLQLMQFPWRLLSFTTITIPIVAFYLLLSLRRAKRLKIIIGILLLISLYFGYRYSTPFYFQNNEQVSQQLYLDRNRTTTSSRLEILPRWGSVETRYIGGENIRVVHGSAEITNQILTPEKLTFTADAKDAETIFRIRRNYFPSWFAHDESGNKYPTRSTDDGLIDFTGSHGLHTYSIYVGSTRVELLANWISLLTILLLVIMVKS